MPSSYKIASQDTHKQLNDLLDESYTDLNSIGVTFDLIMAFAPENESGEKTGPALKLHGYPCNAIVGIVPLKQRVMGRNDAEIILDGDRWDKLSSEQQIAILDHEIYHIVVARNVDGETIIDTHGRPKLKMRLHDRQLGWFDAVAERNGAASFEVEQAAQLVRDAGAIYFQATLALNDKPGKKKPAEEK